MPRTGASVAYCRTARFATALPWACRRAATATWCANSCGATALATILRYAYHLGVDETQVIQGMMGVADVELVKQRDFSMPDVEHHRGMESLGMRAHGYRIDEERLRTLCVPGLV
jgi:predicted double-glycine peptidase